jgi:release factor glutamine methyltransferase
MPSKVGDGVTIVGMTQQAPWTVRRLLEWTSGFFEQKQVDAPRLSAELLLAHVLEQPRIRLYMDYEKVVADAQLQRYRDLVKRASQQEPIAYLTGKAHFFNLEFEIKPGVLIPRPDTETLVENVLQLARQEPALSQARVLELCTGSGCIAAAVAHHLKGTTVTAVDISDIAIEVAKHNFERLGLAERITLLQGDLYEPLDNMVEAAPFDLILANPPYIPSAVIPTLDANVRDYEPHLALDGGADGFDLQRRILDGAEKRLAEGGRIFLEIAYDQGEAALELLGRYPWLGDVLILKDYGGRDRVMTGVRK